ncbi:hypothetical protein BASA50_005459 [Batrachochytrium salamandrivorans]|uniref:Tail specific protease domain-containing protein n=1 Tax=Batrachochytrium salamandrivorans TaxID=1357716 RepID=A0ABQ8FCN9_9FUNG|nr:hypothetical protein BASA50_005459 [Batrachochytrium salamandrivorans]
MLVPFVIALLTTGAASVSASNYATYTLLKNDRAAGRLVFPPTTLAQKEIILSNVKNALAAWANYDSKKANYGPAADPFPIVEKLRKNIEKVTDEDLQLGLTDAFVMTRDQHTRWTNIAPYGCFHATTGVTFTFIEGDADIIKKPTVVVTSTSKHPDLLALFGEDYSKIQAGDELLAINGLSFFDWFEQNKFTSGAGANEFGGQRAALKYLTTIYGKFNRLPSEDFITFQFKSHANPEIIYTVNVPYISIRDEECWDLGSKLYKNIIDATLPGTPETSLPVSAEPSGHNHKSDTAHLFPRGHKMDSPEDPERGATIEKRSISSRSLCFDPEEIGTKGLAIQKAVMIIRSLLVNELKYTKSVMYDLRGNSGDIYCQGLEETVPNSRFTNVVFLNSVKSANTMGQVYLRPMGVLNDGRCYSSCEVFSGAIQGHGAGTIFGEDGRTGGGGASVMELDPFLIRVSPTYFQKFPFTQELTSGSTTYANTLSVGVTRLFPGSTTNTQYDRIAKSLARIGRKNGQNRLHFVCEPFMIEKPIDGFSLEVEAVGIEEFTVFQADGKTVAAQQKASTTKQRFSIPVSTVGSALGNSQITILGKTAGKQVLKTIRNVRIIPADDKYMKISTPGFTFTGLSDSVGLYQSSTTAPADGWNNLKGPWMIGNGVKYASNVDSSIEAFFTAPIGTKINIGIDVALDTKPDCDFLYLSIKSSGGIEDFPLRSKSLDGTKTFNGISGRGITVKGTAPFTTKSESFLFLSSLLLIGLRRSLVLLSTRSLSLLLEIF